VEPRVVEILVDYSNPSGETGNQLATVLVRSRAAAVLHAEPFLPRGADQPRAFEEHSTRPSGRRRWIQDPGLLRHVQSKEEMFRIPAATAS
jgi:hypothetical protein